MDDRIFIGKHIEELPTPALVLDQSVIEKNVQQLHQDVADLGVAFRPHVKTLKCLEVTRRMLGSGKHRKVVASTVPEIEGCLPLVDEGLLDECLYGIPVYPGVLPRLCELSKKLTISLMVDNAAHVDLLEEYQKSNSASDTPEWRVFIKIDVGSRRAGVQLKQKRLEELVRRVERSSLLHLEGFYCHAGQSYADGTSRAAEETLRMEFESLLQAADLMARQQPVILSFGATPTAHVVSSLRGSLPDHIHPELHAGNFIVNDLQQVSTGLVTSKQQALYVVAEVCSVYPERDEALVNAGVIAMSRESSPKFPGFGRVVGNPHWGIVRLSQEHGILAISPCVKADSASGFGDSAESQKVEEVFAVGDKVLLYCQHSCITAAAFDLYYIVEQDKIVRDIWKPWKFW